eukprot:602393-Prymnesium_polylepis.1
MRACVRASNSKSRDAPDCNHDCGCASLDAATASALHFTSGDAARVREIVLAGSSLISSLYPDATRSTRRSTASWPAVERSVGHTRCSLQ